VGKRKQPRQGRSRHDVIRLDNYKRIHNQRMRDFIAEGFVVSDTVTFGQPSRGHVTVRGEIRCLGGLHIDVDKKLRIVSGRGGGMRVKTANYSYNVSVSGNGNMFRYDSAHNHRTQHHVHRYNRKGELAVEDILDENDVPTLGDVIAEARDLYWSPEFNSDEDEDDDDG
jgi:hypothetical protein